jgi:PhoH-like ATPase
MYIKGKKSMSKRKTFVLDTSVLLYDMTSIHSFPGNDVVIPLKVLDELDRFKDRPNLLGESARYVNRYLDDLRKSGSLYEKVTIPNSDQTVRIETRSEKSIELPTGLDPKSGDNIIVATALYLAGEGSDGPLIVVTKDINLRVKCEALGLKAEDYYKDHVELLSGDDDEGTLGYTGQTEVNLTEDEINTFFSTGKIEVDLNSLRPNQLVVGKNGNQSMVGVYRDGYICKIGNPENLISSLISIEPRNKEQLMALWLLTSPDVPLVSITGIAGSGKTFLTLMAGLAGLSQGEGKYERIIVTRSIQPVGRDLGYLPGDMNEKMSPWLAPIVDNVRHAFKDITYFDIMKQKGEVEVAPLAYIRGRTFNNSFVIVDEAQNATIHELKTIITRIGKGSKIVLLGDTDQVDTPYIDSFSNGLTVTIEKFKDHKLSGHITLVKGQRSDIATAASNIL